MIKLQLDRNSDTLYLRLGYAPVVESEEVSPGIVLDYNDKDQVVGIEILRVSSRAPELDVDRFVFESTPSGTRNNR